MVNSEGKCFLSSHKENVEQQQQQQQQQDRLPRRDHKNMNDLPAAKRLHFFIISVFFPSSSQFGSLNF